LAATMEGGGKKDLGPRLLFWNYGFGGKGESPTYTDHRKGKRGGVPSPLVNYLLLLLRDDGRQKERKGKGEDGNSTFLLFPDFARGEIEEKKKRGKKESQLPTVLFSLLQLPEYPANQKTRCRLS